MEDVKILFTGLYAFLETNEQRGPWVKLLAILFHDIPEPVQTLRESMNIGRITAANFFTMTVWSAAYKAKLDHPDTTDNDLLVKIFLEPPSAHIPFFLGQVYEFEKLDGFSSCISVQLELSSDQPQVTEEDTKNNELYNVGSTDPIVFVFNFNRFETLGHRKYYIGNNRRSRRSLFLKLW